MLLSEECYVINYEVSLYVFVIANICVVEDFGEDGSLVVIVLFLIVLLV